MLIKRDKSKSLKKVNNVKNCLMNRKSNKCLKNYASYASIPNVHITAKAFVKEFFTRNVERKFSNNILLTLRIFLENCRFLNFAKMKKH